jgi:hypothetical protein
MPSPILASLEEEDEEDEDAEGASQRKIMTDRGERASKRRGT